MRGPAHEWGESPPLGVPWRTRAAAAPQDCVVTLELRDPEHELRAHSALGIVLAALGLQLAADKSELAARGLELAA